MSRDVVRHAAGRSTTRGTRYCLTNLAIGVVVGASGMIVVPVLAGLIHELLTGEGFVVSRRPLVLAVPLGLLLWGLIALACVGVAHAGAPQSVVMEQAKLSAVQFWEDAGYVPRCNAKLEIDYGISAVTAIAAEARWNDDYSDCRIAIARWFQSLTFDVVIDRFDRRQRLVLLWVVMAHELGHELGFEHSAGGLMAANADDIKPPAAAIEWAISLTPRPQGQRSFDR